MGRVRCGISCSCLINQLHNSYSIYIINMQISYMLKSLLTDKNLILYLKIYTFHHSIIYKYFLLNIFIFFVKISGDGALLGKDLGEKQRW